MPYFNYNGDIHIAKSAVIHPGNRALLSGEGLIETMLWEAGKVGLWDYHLRRLTESAGFLGIDVVHLKTILPDEINKTITANLVKASGIIRLEVFQEDPEAQPGFLIECRPKPPGYKTTPTIGIASSVIKCADSIAHIKSSSRLVYTRAKTEATGRGWTDALLLNQYGRVAESTICNIFWECENVLYTPPLSEGCIAGVFRQYLIDKKDNIEERALTINELYNASAVFLCNAVRGIFPVKVIPA